MFAFFWGGVLVLCSDVVSLYSSSHSVSGLECLEIRCAGAGGLIVGSVVRESFDECRFVWMFGSSLGNVLFLEIIHKSMF